MVQLGRQRTGPSVTWIETDVQDLPLPDATVDVALSAFGLIFAPRPAVALAQLRRVLVPSGRLASPRGPPMAVSPSEPASSRNSCPPTQRLLTHGVGVIQTSWRAG
jgi:SAM-dependent methyltransferase